MNKKYAALAVATAGAMSLALVAPAFAATTASVPTSAASQTWGQGRGGMKGMMGSMKPGVAGKVTAINGTTITISGRATGGPRPTTTGTPTTHVAGTRPTPPAPVMYTVDASAATVTKGTTASTVSAIAVGDQIFAAGTVNGTSITATTIMDGLMRGGMGKGGMGSGIQGNGQPVVAGSVTSVNGSSFTLTNSGNASYTIDATNAVVKKGNATSTVANIASGDEVIVQGTVNGSAVTATTVFDQGAKASTGTGSNGAPKKGIMGSIGNFFKKLFGF